MNDTRKYILFGTLGVIGLLTILGLWWRYAGSGSGSPMGSAIAVEIEEVRMGSIVQRIKVVGTLRADNEVTIHPEIDGRIKKINFQEGQLVNAGDPLVEIEDASYQAKSKEAQALLNFAKLELDRYTRLTDQSAGSLKNKERAQSELLQAEARYAQAALQLEHTIIKAPFTGYVGLKQFSVGALIDPRIELLTIVDVDPIKVDYRVPAKYLRSLSKGQEVKVTVDSFPDEIFRARIDALDPKVDSAANSVLVRALIPNKDGRLKPGLFARVDMVVGSKDDALLLPESSVLTSGDESSVYVVEEADTPNGKVSYARKVQVVVGISESGIVEIQRGLKDKEKVISVGQTKVQNGYPVRIVNDINDESEFDESLNKMSTADKAEKPKENAGSSSEEGDKNQ
ncbi:MAG: efflux RND transporter periplasmic adaptor subunit [Alphaproteobacteria bacterium]|nr:efflux RND transporter periplasmic adaptor subunit [Alphaproteobacteria bacterium]